MAAASDPDSPDLIVSGTVHTLDVPLDSIHNKEGFAMDFGSSVLKLTFALRIDDKVRLHFVSFPRERMDEAFEFVKKKVGDKLEPGQEIFLTGVGTNQYKDQLERTFNIRMKTVFETDCFVDGFQFLVKHVSSRDLFHPPSKKVKEYDKAITESMIETYKTIANLEGGRLDLCPVMEQGNVAPMSEDDIFPEVVEYPALLFMCGSAGGPLYVKETGRYESYDMVPVCGRTLLGAGSLLADSHSFEHLVELAEKGDAGAINVMGNQVVDEKADDGSYSNMKLEADFPAFILGHAVGQNINDFKQEDRAAGAVSLVCNSLGAWCQLWAAKVKAKHAYFCGGIHTNSQYVRDEIHKVFAQKASIQYDGLRTHAHFMKLGAYLGSLGCLLHNLRAPDPQAAPTQPGLSTSKP